MRVKHWWVGQDLGLRFMNGSLLTLVLLHSVVHNRHGEQCYTQEQYTCIGEKHERTMHLYTPTREQYTHECGVWRRFSCGGVAGWRGGVFSIAYSPLSILYCLLSIVTVGSRIGHRAQV